MRSTSWASIAARGGLDHPEGTLRTIIMSLYDQRVWFNLWTAVAELVGWWAQHGQPDAAKVVLGHLDAHHHAAVEDAMRSTLHAFPDHDGLVARGASVGRDELVAFILDRLGP